MLGRAADVAINAVKCALVVDQMQRMCMIRATQTPLAMAARNPLHSL